jgi:hypothetical protein
MPGIEEFKAILRQRKEEHGTSFSSWQDVLLQFKKFNPNDGNFYMLSVNKGTPDEARSRFLTYAETLETIIKEVEKERVRV